MGVVNVDDRSWDISYSNGWFLGGTENEFDTTTHGITSAGATATFAFTGTSVTVYGTISDQSSPGGGPVSTYSLDGGTAKTFAAIPARTVQYKFPFYTSPKLDQGYHTLVITTTRQNSTFWLDYISYTFDDSKSVVTSSSTSTSSTSSTQQPTIATTSVITPGTTSTSAQVSTPLSSSRSITNSQVSIFTTTSDGKTITFSTSGDVPASSAASTPSATSSTSGTKSTVSSGTIIGAAIGGVALLIAMIFLVWVLCRRRRRGAAYIPAGGASSSDDAQSFQAGHISTFVEQPATYQTYPVNREFHKLRPNYAPAMQPASQSSEAGGSGISSMYTNDDDAPNGPQMTSPAFARLYYDETPSSSKARAVAVVYEPHPFEDPQPPSYHIR